MSHSENTQRIEFRGKLHSSTRFHVLSASTYVLEMNQDTAIKNTPAPSRNEGRLLTSVLADANIAEVQISKNDIWDVMDPKEVAW